MPSYTVSCCNNCGNVYADGIPQKEAFDKYYTQSSKYEFSHTGGLQHQAELDRLSSLSSWLALQIPLSLGVLDAGCATGELLIRMKQHGFTNLTGLDPSSACVEYARNKNGLTMIQGVLGHKPETIKSFDVVILSAVLEHIPDLHVTIDKLKTWLKPGGFVVLETPDVEFFELGINAPYQEFSVEHINFFSVASMTNLMSQFGFELKLERHFVCGMGKGVTSATLTTIFQLTGKVTEVVHESNSLNGLTAYIKKCQEWETYETNQINQIVDKQEPILVWGTGTLCQRLLATTRFKDANILAFIDSNNHYQGNKLQDKPIIAPQQVSEYSCPILITSWVFQDEITKQIKESLKLNNQIITLMPEN
jgi:2-polyprenyl-3-methyl-5-hydroxy-6-metoxy-1,4-benzoquinol methylase